MTAHKITPPPEKVYIKNKERIFCDGTGDSSGHPGVYLTIPAGKEWIECPYCDRRFVLEPEED